MRAAVCRTFGEPLVIEDVAIAGPGRGELAVSLAACAICQSDIHYLKGAWGGSLPAVYGHEAAGVVAEVGADVDGFAVGDHVVVTLIRSCGACDACGAGDSVFCEATFPLDERSPLTAADGTSIVQGLRTGAFAEEVVVDASQAVVIAPEIPLDRAALLACGVVTGFGAVVNTAGVKAGSSVAVIGAGGVGLNAVQGAAFAGATTIVAIDVSDSKLETSRAFGATHTANSTGGDAGVSRGRHHRRAPRRLRHRRRGRRQRRRARAAARSGVVERWSSSACRLRASPPPSIQARSPTRASASSAARWAPSRIAVDIPALAALYLDGRLLLDELISGHYPLDRINEAIASASNGSTIRNVIRF